MQSTFTKKETARLPMQVPLADTGIQLPRHTENGDIMSITKVISETLMLIKTAPQDYSLQPINGVWDVQMKARIF